MSKLSIKRHAINYEKRTSHVVLKHIFSEASLVSLTFELRLLSDSFISSWFLHVGSWQSTRASEKQIESILICFIKVLLSVCK